MSINDELSRVLKNPDNVIVSDELALILQDEKETTEETTFLLIEANVFGCQVQKVLMSGNNITFSLEVPTFPLIDFLTVKTPIKFMFEDLEYVQFMPADVLWEDNILTLVTRRIFNEAV